MKLFFYFKTGDNGRGLEWLRKGFQQNSGRLSILQFLSGFPAVGDDPVLFAQINNRLAAAGFQNFSEMPVPQASPETRFAAPGVPAPGSSQTGVSGDGMFQITLGPGIDSSGRMLLASELNRMYERIASRIGTLSVPIFVNFISAEGMGPTIAMYDPQNTSIIVTTVYYDGDMIRNIVTANFDAFSEEEMGPLIEEFPGHVLAGELTRLIIQILIPEAKTNKNRTAWVQIGLAEILGGSKISQRYRMLVAQKSTQAGIARMASAAMLNSIFAEGYTSPAVFETATAQAYLMAAFLVKKSGSIDKGCRDLMKLIELISKGSELDSALQQVYKLGETEFEASWKEAAFWALKQGTPYEW